MKPYITSYRATNEGVILELSCRARTKGTGYMYTKEWFISWDRIGEAIFEGYEVDYKTLLESRKEIKKITN